ncbi:MAG: thioredoxin family protein [Cytophagaceae bacterium]|nr:MAG: thioredoxin family protein [Cytophagaceae bacterium]
MSEVQSTFQLKPGAHVADFSLPDADGKIFSRADVCGDRGLVIVFACNHCPYVKHLADSLGTLAKEMAPLGVHTVAINSNDIENYPQDGPEEMKVFAATHGWEFPYLLDETQEVAKAYGAACTPDFFLCDAGGRLFYAGQYDDSRPRSGLDAHGGDLREAVRLMLGGEQPLVRPYPSSGCNIKWKPGNEPT